MKIALAGSTGFIGSYVGKYLTEKGHQIVPLFREDFSQHNISFKLLGCDAIINLAGNSVLRRWNERNIEKITESRVGTTSSLVHTISVINHPPGILINASAIAIYSNMPEQTEKSLSHADGFLSELVEEWESEAIKGIYSGTRVVIARMGVVLGKNGGIIKKLLPLFRTGLRTYMGNGRQKMSYIHIYDLARAIEYFLLNEETSDVYNLTTPAPVSNKEFSKKLAAVVNKKTIYPLPAFFLRLIFGKASSFLLESKDVLPERLINSGFRFQYPDIDSCLKNLDK